MTALLRLALLLAFCGCTPPGAEAPPGLLLVSLDTTRSDHLSAYGYPRQTSAPPIGRAAASAGLALAGARGPASLREERPGLRLEVSARG